VRVEYHKLVRDSIPDIIRRSGSRCEVAVMAAEEYRRALREKLVEEASEAAAAEANYLIVELADLCEVMDALMASYEISAEAMRAEQERRRAERGGFAQRLRLLWTENNAQE
jgi:predicted house-cleaning noncanonical NTP pyrophosphatase (MazG superfamily)